MPTNRETAQFYIDPIDPELRELEHRRNQNSFERALGNEPEPLKPPKRPSSPTSGDTTPPYGGGGLAE